MKKLTSNIYRSKLNDNIQFFILALPAILFFIVFAYLPIGGIVLAFKKFKVNLGIFKSPWNGFDNLEFFFKSSDAFRVVRNTVGLNLLFIVFVTIFSIIFALIMFEIAQKSLIKAYQTITIIPSFLSWVVISYMVYSLLDPGKGIVNRVIVAFGGEAISWYTSPQYWPFILLIVSLWQGVGSGSVLYFASLMGIDTEYFNAADIDGASKLQQIIYIKLPFLLPLVTILTILNIGKIFRADFGLFFNVTKNAGALYPTTDVIDTYVYRALISLGDIGMSAAVGFFQSLVGFVLILLTNYIVRKMSPENSLF